MEPKVQRLVSSVQAALGEFLTAYQKTVPTDNNAKARGRKAVGDHLRAIRESRGLPMRAWAKVLGVSHVCIFRIERGDNLPSLAMLYQFADRLKVSVHELIPENMS